MYMYILDTFLRPTSLHLPRETQPWRTMENLTCHS